MTAGNALSTLASFLRNVFIARLVSVEDFGIVVLLALTLSAVETISNIAIDRLLIQAPDGDEPGLQANSHALQSARGVTGGFVVYFCAPWIAVLFKIPDATWAFQTLALVPAIRGFMHLDTVRFQREMLFGPTFWVIVAPQAASLALAIPLVYWLRDYSVIVWAMLAQALAQTAITHFLASRPYRWALEPVTVRRVLAFGWPLLANGLLMFVIFEGDKAVIATAFTPEVVGWYGAALMLTMAPAMFVTSVLQSLMLPPLSRLQKEPEQFRLRYTQVIHACLLLGLLTAAIFAVFGPELLVALFGKRYISGTDVVIVLGLTQGVRIVKSGQFVSAVALADTKTPFIANLARGAALGAAIGLVAIGYGPLAVAVMGLVGEIASYAIATHLLARRLKSPTFEHFPQVAVWLSLAGLSWVVGLSLRQFAEPFVQLFSGLLCLFITVAVFIYGAHGVRGGLNALFGEIRVGSEKRRISQDSNNRREDPDSMINERYGQWARDKEKRAMSILSPLLMTAYRIKALRQLCLSLARRLEGGEMNSVTLRRLLKRFHGVLVGHYSYGGCMVSGLLPPGTKVGNFCSIAEGLCVFRRNHPTGFLSQHPFFYNSELGLLVKDTIEGIKDNPLNIGHDVWIGSGVTILPGCKHIGNGAIVGAGSVVTCDIPPFTIYAGNPARRIRERFNQEICALIDKTQWWNLPLSKLDLVLDQLVCPVTKTSLEECIAKLEGSDVITR